MRTTDAGGYDRHLRVDDDARTPLAPRLASDAGRQWGSTFGTLAEAGLAIYDEVMVPRMFEPWARLLVEELAVAPGESVLDVACGPGSVARVAAERVGASGRVTGCDLSEAMLKVARAKPPVAGGAALDYRHAPADRLPVEDGEFDVVLCQQGLQFFPDRPAAVREMHRALRPGGRAGVLVSTGIENSPPFHALAKGVEAAAGRDLAERYRAGPFGLPERERLHALLAGAGFAEIAISEQALPVRFEHGAAQVVATLAVTPLAGEIDRLSSSDKQRLIDVVARQAGDGPIDSQLEAHLAIARRLTARTPPRS